MDRSNTAVVALRVGHAKKRKGYSNPVTALSKYRVLLAILLAAPKLTLAIQTYYLDVNATVAAAPSPQVTLDWDSQASWTVIDISRRTMGDTGASWAARGSVSYPATTFVDSVTHGIVYEYRVHRAYNASYSTYQEVAAYAAVTWDAPLAEARGQLLLAVDNTVTNALAGELRRLELDLVGDGWTVRRLDFGRAGDATPTMLRSAITNAWAASGGELKALYLFGHLPVAKSGFTAPDGHSSLPQHADGFFADMDGVWTDVSNFGTANAPGDGIYDQNYFPSKVELMAGRVDLSGMTGFHKREIEYLRDYIHKSHAFRYGARTEVTRRGLWNSRYLYQERNWLNPLFGTANVTYAAFQPTLSADACLFGIDFAYYGGAGPDYTETPNKLIFGINFGSGKLYWANGNNAMRALLAQPDWGLTCAWGARPAWFFHHMGAGFPVGYAALRTMNNWTSDRDYYPVGDYSWMAGMVQESLMGDPTLRLHPVAPPQDVAVVKQGDAAVLTWQASSDAAVSLYQVCSSTNRLGPYVYLTPGPALCYTNSAPPAGDVYYQVRAIKREITPAAIYTNASQGVFARLNADGTANRSPLAQGATVATAKNQSCEIPLAGSDADGDAVTPIVLKNPQHGELRWNAAQVVYVPLQDYAGPDAVVWMMSDGVAASAPATVQIDVVDQPNLLEWEFGSPSNNVPQAMDSTTNAPGILPTTIALGSALSLRTDLAIFQNDAFCLNGVPAGGLDSNSYVEWTVAPAVNHQMNLAGVSLGLWNYQASRPVNVELRWSDDAFVTWHNVPLGAPQVSDTGLGYASNQGMPFAGSLAGFPAFEACTNTIMFRLHFWYDVQSSYSGIGKVGDTRPDLVISGTVEPLSYAVWAAGLDWQGEDSSEGADPDHDGLPNKLEFLLGRDPLVAGSDFSRLAVEADGQNGWYFIIEFLRRRGIGGVTAQTRVDLLLGDWIDRPIDGNLLIEEIVDPDPLGDGSVEAVRWNLRLTSEDTQQFLRFLAP